jgi:hypothetical protein
VKYGGNIISQKRYGSREALSATSKTTFLLLRECMSRALPSNGRCVQSHRLATCPYAKIASFHLLLSHRSLLYKQSKHYIAYCCSHLTSSHCHYVCVANNYQFVFVTKKERLLYHSFHSDPIISKLVPVYLKEGMICSVEGRAYSAL